MLRVNARVGPSQIHGSGLIARELIPLGTVVWRFQPGFDVLLPATLLEALPTAVREQVQYWSFHHTKTDVYVMSSDDDRFTNHADEPNTRVDDDCTIAVRDIHPGEEITNNYNELAELGYPSPESWGSRCQTPGLVVGNRR